MSEPDDGSLDDVQEEHPKLESCYLCNNTENLKKCIQCSNLYCFQDTNRIDKRYCAECLSDIIITEEIFTKTSEEYDEKTDTIHHTKHSCKDILFNGIDWMFACKRLSNMTDEEAKHELLYHKAMISFLESDLLQRSVKNYKLKIQSDIDKKHAKATARIEKITETKVKKVVKFSQSFDPVAFAKELIRLGITNINLDEKK